MYSKKEERQLKSDNLVYLKGIKSLFGLHNEKQAAFLFSKMSPDTFIALCSRHKMIGHVYRALEKSQEISISHMKALKEAFKYQVRRSQLLMYELNRIRSAFSKRNIPCLFVKGPILSQRLYGEPSVRYTWDTDILVDPDNTVEAYSILKELSYEAKDPQLFENVNKVKAFCKLSKNVELYHSGLNLCVELHWRLISKNVCLLEIKEPFKGTQSIKFNDSTYLVLEELKEIVYLILHASLHKWSTYQLIHDIHNLLIQKKDHIDSIVLFFDKNGYGIIWEQALSIMKKWYPNTKIKGGIRNVGTIERWKIKYLDFVSILSIQKWSARSASIIGAYKSLFLDAAVFIYIINSRWSFLKRLSMIFLQSQPLDPIFNYKGPKVLIPFLKIMLAFRPIYTRIFSR